MIAQQHFSPDLFHFQLEAHFLSGGKGQTCICGSQHFQAPLRTQQLQQPHSAGFLPLFVCPKHSSPVNFDITESIIAWVRARMKTSQISHHFQVAFPQASAHGLTLNFGVFSEFCSNLSWQVQFVFPHKSVLL